MKHGNYIAVILSGFLLAAACGISAGYTQGDMRRYFDFAGELLFILSVFCIFLWISRFLKSRKVGERLFSWLKRKVRDKFEKVSQAFNRFVSRHGSKLHYYRDTVEWMDVADRKQTGYSSIRLKWRDMHTDGEKVRYIYIKYIQKAIQTGFRFKSTDTPNEISDLFSKLKTLSNEQLFILYNRVRYAEDDGITPEDVQVLLLSTGIRHHR